MGLEDSLKRMIALRNTIRKSDYFRRRCAERGFDPDEVVGYVSNGDIVAIENQADDKIKLTFFKDETYDINIIVQVRPERIDFVTVFPSERDRRLKR